MYIKMEQQVPVDISIVTTTFNSEQFIREAMQAVLGQNRNRLTIEYILADDGSSDNTIEKIGDVAKEFDEEETVRVIDHGRHVGIVRNFFSAIAECSGKYIATCDADDIWTDSKKLLTQYCYMESAPSCVLSYHASTCVASEEWDPTTREARQVGLGKMFETPHTSTLMFRNGVFDIPWALTDKMTRMNDQLLRFILEDKGNFEFIAGIAPTVRTVRSKSIFQSPRSRKERTESSLYNWEAILDHFQGSDNQTKLAARVDGFKSRLRWDDFKSSPNLAKLAGNITEDVRTGIALRNVQKIGRLPLRLGGKLKRAVFTSK